MRCYLSLLILNVVVALIWTILLVLSLQILGEKVPSYMRLFSLWNRTTLSNYATCKMTKLNYNTQMTKLNYNTHCPLRSEANREEILAEIESLLLRIEPLLPGLEDACAENSFYKFWAQLRYVTDTPTLKIFQSSS